MAAAPAGLVFDLRLSCRGGGDGEPDGTVELSRRSLYEVKTVQYSTSSSGSWYRSRQMRAVDQRALRVLPERFRDGAKTSLCACTRRG